MTEHSTYSVLIIDDHPLFRKGVGQLIEMEEDLNLVAEAQSGQEGIKLARIHQPDIILLDLNMKGMNGIETLKHLKDTELECTVIVLTVSNAGEDLVNALHAGADGYLLKDMEPEDLLPQIRKAANGHIVMDASLSGLLASMVRTSQSSPPSDNASLTQRERQILALVAEGKSNKLIARELDISAGTVKVHVKNLLKKLNVNSRVEAAVWALGQKNDL